MALYAFDGTSREDKVNDEQDSNVVRFARAYRGSRVYLPGVGTRFGAPGALLGGWIGLGLHQRVREALNVLKRNLDRGDTAIDVVGFSRGAAAAVHFCNEVWEKVGKKQDNAPTVRFLGLFDTVASTGVIPGPFDVNLDLKVPPNVRRCSHAMALDEGRGSFHVHRMKPRKAGTLPQDAIEEVWFRGCHSDIGGGSMHERLANITLCWMMRRAGSVGASFAARDVEAAVSGRDPQAPVKRAKFDEGLGKRKPRPGDFVHSSVFTREANDAPWHVNPVAGCHVVDDTGLVTGPFPMQSPWPTIPEAEWTPALVESRVLSVGDLPVTFQVFADAFWNETPHVLLEKDATYRFTVVDGPHGWVDGSITKTNGAAGYDTKVLDRFKHLARYRKAGWFALIGAVDRDELFPIRSGVDYTPQQTGEFSCFANDAWSRYGNNRGQLTLSVERIA